MDFTESSSKRSLSSELSDEEVNTSKPEGRPSKKGRSSGKARDSPVEIPVSNKFACLEATVTDTDESFDSSVAKPCTTDSTPGSLSKQPVVESVATDQRERATRSSFSKKLRSKSCGGDVRSTSRSPLRNGHKVGQENKTEIKPIKYP